MPASEAADVCRFASSVVNALNAPYVGVALDLDGVLFVLYKVKSSCLCILQKSLNIPVQVLTLLIQSQ